VDWGSIHRLLYNKCENWLRMVQHWHFETERDEKRIRERETPSMKKRSTCFKQSIKMFGNEDVEGTMS
jgi:hypothetical protein